MIQGNQTWTNALAQPQKRVLYTFEIADLGILLASFADTQARVDRGGYGVTEYGVGGYGT